MTVVIEAPWAWLAALREPGVVGGWSLAEWQRVVRLSRRLRLLGRLAEAVAAHGEVDRVPEPVARQLEAELRFARWQTRALQWAAERVGVALFDAPYPRVLLKGAAYIADGMALGRGRLPSDIDMLVPRSALPDAQRRLAEAGWKELPLDDHDARYYREWSHEAPPMRHAQHSLELDLHHNILPPVARVNVDADLLLARVRPSSWAGWHVLDPLDQILHSAAHLFQDSELTDRLRDLVDLDALMRLHVADDARWSLLIDRACQLGLGEPLALACHFLRAWFQTPIPQHAHDRLRGVGPGLLQRPWLLPALTHTLTPVEPDARPCLGQRLGPKIILTRYHLTRLPLHLLVPHVWHKLRHGAHASSTDGEPGPRTVDDRSMNS